MELRKKDQKEKVENKKWNLFLPQWKLPPKVSKNIYLR